MKKKSQTTASILLGSQAHSMDDICLCCGAGIRYRWMSAAGARAVAKQLQAAVAINRRDRQTDRRKCVW